MKIIIFDQCYLNFFMNHSIIEIQHTGEYLSGILRITFKKQKK